MTLNEVIMKLTMLWNNPTCPETFKPELEMVIEALSELEEPEETSLKEQCEIEQYAETCEECGFCDTISRQRAVEAAKEPVNPMYTWAATSIKEIETVSSLVKSITKQVQDAIAGRIEQLPLAQLGTNLADVGTDCISRQAVIDIALHYCPDDDGVCSKAGHDPREMLDEIEALPPAQPETHEERTETNGVCLDAISRQAAIDICANAIDLWRGQLGEGALIAVRDKIKELPPAQQNLSEEYAKAVRNWLVNYQIKCAELKGRYTPYEVLGWIVSDWRKENGIW